MTTKYRCNTPTSDRSPSAATRSATPSISEFIQDGGYRARTLWDEAGWNWLRAASQMEHPDHWRLSRLHDWYGVGLRGAYAAGRRRNRCRASAITRHSAFARWAGARLPHEYQWEAACRSGVLEAHRPGMGMVREYLSPLRGFPGRFLTPTTPQPWFDDRHYSLHGGSLHTRPPSNAPVSATFSKPTSATCLPACDWCTSRLAAKSRYISA